MFLVGQIVPIDPGNGPVIASAIYTVIAVGLALLLGRHLRAKNVSGGMVTTVVVLTIVVLPIGVLSWAVLAFIYRPQPARQPPVSDDS